MPALVKAAEKVAPAEEAQSLVAVLRAGEADPGKVIAFSELASGLTGVAEDQGAVVAIGEASQGVRATGLHTCAAICFVNSGRGGPAGYVYHANAGAINYGKFMEIIGAIGARGEFEELYVVYAHRDDSDRSHERTIAELRNWLRQGGKLVQITNLFLNQFGMNGHFQIGY
ncbi:MAG TPA: hypothetical protein VGG25_17630 [Streptosporangiaceae bacterium]|jgi:hypothetical protein